MFQEHLFALGIVKLHPINVSVFPEASVSPNDISFSIVLYESINTQSSILEIITFETSSLVIFNCPSLPNTQPFKLSGANPHLNCKQYKLCIVRLTFRLQLSVEHTHCFNELHSVNLHSMLSRQSINMDDPFADSTASASYKEINSHGFKNSNIILTQPSSVMTCDAASICANSHSNQPIEIPSQCRSATTNDGICPEQVKPLLSKIRQSRQFSESLPAQRRHVKILPLLSNDVNSASTCMDMPTSTKSSPVGNVFSASPFESNSFSMMLMSESNPANQSSISCPPVPETSIPAETDSVYIPNNVSNKFFRRFRSLSTSQGNVYNNPISTYTPPDTALPLSLPDPDKLPKTNAVASQQIAFSKCLNLRNYTSATGMASVRKGVSMDYISSRMNDSSSTHSLPRQGTKLHEYSKSLTNEMLMAQLATIPSRDELEHSLKPIFKHGPKQQAIQMGVRRVSESSRFLMLSKSSMRSPEDFLQHGVEKLEEERAYGTYFHHSTCYDVMPYSYKLVVIDGDLPVGKAFRALLTNEIRAAPIWSSRVQRYTGMLTISDFIRIMDVYYHSPHLKLESVESQTVAHWMEAILGQNKVLLYGNPEDSLMYAARVLYQHRVRRLPILDSRSGNLLHIITHKILLKHLWQRHVDLPPDPRLRFTLQEIGLITSKKIHESLKTAECTPLVDSQEVPCETQEMNRKSELYCVYPTTSIVRAMRLFVEHDITVLPVVDPDNGRLLHVLRTYDCIHLVSDDFRKYLDITVQHVLQKCSNTHGTPPTCLSSDTLQSSIEKFFFHNVQHLAVVDSETSLIPKAILSLSRVLAFLIFDGDSLNNMTSSSGCFDQDSLNSSFRDSTTIASTGMLLRSHLRHQRQRHLSYPNESFPEEEDNPESTEHTIDVTVRVDSKKVSTNDVFNNATTSSTTS